MAGTSILRRLAQKLMRNEAQAVPDMGLVFYRQSEHTGIRPGDWVSAERLEPGLFGKYNTKVIIDEMTPIPIVMRGRNMERDFERASVAPIVRMIEKYNVDAPDVYRVGREKSVTAVPENYAKGGQVKPKATYTTASVTPFEDDGLQGLTRKYEQVATYAKGGQVKGIVDTLKGLGVDSSFDYRAELFASLFPGESYVGSANQNNRLVAYLKGQYEAPEPAEPQPVVPQAQGLNVRQPLFERPAGEPYRPDPGRDAIEGFYPEANLLPAAKVAKGASVLKPHPSRVTTIKNREAKEAYQFAQRAKQYRQQHRLNDYSKGFARGGVVGASPELGYNPAEIEAIANQLAEEIYG